MSDKRDAKGDSSPATSSALSLVKRLREYNTPDRAVDHQRQIAVDIHEAADMIESLVSETERNAIIEREEQWGRQQRIELLELALEQYAMRPGADGEIARIALKNAAPSANIVQVLPLAPQPETVTTTTHGARSSEPALVCAWTGGACRHGKLLGTPSATALRDMNDAPKDGTPILGFIPSYYQGKGAWVVVVWMPAVRGMGDASWMDNRAWAVKPSCWMPLPVHPVAEADRGVPQK